MILGGLWSVWSRGSHARRGRLLRIQDAGSSRTGSVRRKENQTQGRDWILVQHLVNTIPPVEPPEAERPMSTAPLMPHECLNSPGPACTLQPFASWLCPEVLSGLTVRVESSIGTADLQDSPACTL